MGQLEDPEQESEVLEEATEFLIQQAIRVGDDEDDAEDTLNPLQPSGDTGSEAATVSLNDKQDSLALNTEEEPWEARGSNAAPAAAAGAHDDNSARLDDSMRDPQTEQNLEYGGWDEDSGEESELSEELMAEMALATAQQSSAWGASSARRARRADTSSWTSARPLPCCPSTDRLSLQPRAKQRRRLSFPRVNPSL